MEALLAAVAAPVTALFSYNRGNFMYDRGQDLTKKYQSYSFQVNQFGLYREDVRDLVALTIDKTNNYQVVVALELGFIIALIGPARLPEGTPSWIVWLTFASLCEGVVFLLLAMWFAAHASISASSYGARLLTQHVRLPVPSDEQLSGAITRADDFEAANMKKMLRMPFLKATFKKLWDRDGSSKEDIAKDMLAAGEHEQVLVPLLTHIRLYRKLQQFWINFDAYSRISLSIGTYSMLKALCFYSLGYYVHTMRNFYSGFVGVVLFNVLATLLMMLDMMLTNKEIALACVLFSVPTVIASVGMGFQYGINPEPKNNKTLYDFLRVTLVDILVPVVHVSVAAFNLWLLKKACPEVTDEDAVIPIHFRVVHFLDVFRNLRHNHTDRAISALNREADRNDLDPALAKVQAEGALSGALDEWKSQKNTARAMALLEIALDLADAAGLGENNTLVRRAKLHAEELRVIQELQKERRLLQRLQAPGIIEAVPEGTRKEIEALYHRLPKLGGLTTEINDIGALNFGDTWLCVNDKDSYTSYYVSLGEQHKREPHVSKESLVIQLEAIRDDIDNLKTRRREIESLHHQLQEHSLRDANSTQGHHRKHVWYRDEHDAANNDTNALEGPEVQNSSSSANRASVEIVASRDNVYSVGYILRELGSAFAPKKYSMNIDNQRLVASFFPWKMFRAATFCVVAVWVIMGILRCVAIWKPAKEVIFFAEFAVPTPPAPTNPSRRVLRADWDSFVHVPRINQPLFDPSTVACADSADTVLGNSYMAYSTHDGARRCTHEHRDIGYVDGSLMALSDDGVRLIPCDASENAGALDSRSVYFGATNPLRRVAVMGPLAVGIPTHRDGVILFERRESGFRPIASLSNDRAIDVSITHDKVFALMGSTIVSWRLSDAQRSAEHVITPGVGKEYTGFCATHSMIVILEREQTDDGMWSKTQARQMPMMVD